MAHLGDDPNTRPTPSAASAAFRTVHSNTARYPNTASPTLPIHLLFGLRSRFPVRSHGHSCKIYNANAHRIYLPTALTGTRVLRLIAPLHIACVHKEKISLSRIDKLLLLKPVYRDEVGQYVRALVALLGMVFVLRPMWAASEEIRCDGSEEMEIPRGLFETISSTVMSRCLG
jgi:hypothetical protein